VLLNPTIKGRVARVRSIVHRRGLDGMIVSSLPHVRYLTGFTGSNGACMITQRSALFVTDLRYRDQARDEVRGFRRIITSRGLFEGSASRRPLSGCKRVGFDSGHVTYALYRSLRSLFPEVLLVPTVGVVDSLMRTKDAEEVACIQQAAEITDRVFMEVLAMIAPGVVELDIAAEISYLQRRQGAERDAFDILVAGGERAAFPHAKASTRKISRNEMVILDFGCVVRGYASDLTRTVHVGRPSRRAVELYRVVQEAQQEALAAVTAGMRARDLDAIARKRIQRAGWGRYFNHSLGHGLGMHVHEAPRVSALSTDTIAAGDVITIEPGVYIPDYGGVRIEDDVLVLEHGCRVFNASPKELMIL
jgi:Xaa-Pro aminopeptidase